MASVEAPLREFVTRLRGKLVPVTGCVAAKHSATTKKAKEVTTLRTGAEWKPMNFLSCTRRGELSASLPSPQSDEPDRRFVGLDFLRKSTSGELAAL